MFYGEYIHSLDEKGRVILPAKFREQLTKQKTKNLFLTRGLDGCLFLFTGREWRIQEEKFKKLSFTHQEARRFNRLYFSGAVEITPDRQGRILIPQYLKNYADIKRELVIVGVSSRMEIWSKKRWEEFYKASQPNFEEIAEKLMEIE
jgi:MraZ protein